MFNLSDETTDAGELVLVDFSGQVIIGNYDIKKAKAYSQKPDGSTENIVQLKLTKSGTAKFGEYSTEAFKSHEACFVYLEGNLIESATIMAPILDENLVLNCFFSYEDAKDCAKAINHYK